MPISVNKVKAEGNVIYIKSNPVTGVIALTSFVDNVAGETSSVSFTKQFRYSTNGIIFSDWLPLTTGNITAIQVAKKDTIVIELAYKKNTGSTSLTVTNATIGTTNDPITNSFYFKNSIFSEFFGSEDLEVLNWTINVLDKLYQKGLIPNYIDRLNDFGSANDFIEFWRSICKFFAYYVVYARKYQKFYESDALLTEYIEQRGLKVTPDNTVTELQGFMKTFYTQISRRGTKNVINGELSRLIYRNTADEFIFNNNLPHHIGWNVSNSSPCYRSNTIHDNANKFYEQSVEPLNITKYPVTAGTTITEDAGKRVIKIPIAGGGIEGDDKSFIPVDAHMDYEFFFMIKKTDGNNLTVGLKAYNINANDGTSVNLKSVKNNSILNNYFVNKNLQRSDKYIGVRVFLYSKFKPLDANDNLNIKMVDGVTHIAPVIKMSTGEARIYNIRLTPMSTPYSKGFIQVNNWIDLWLKNNNNQNRIEDVYDYITKYLIPYNSHLKLTETEKAGEL